MNDLYRQKLEKENQELLQQIAAIEAENTKLREDIEKADKPKPETETDVMELIKNEVQKEIDEEFVGRLNTSATQILLQHRLNELTKKYSDMYVQHKLSSPINLRFTINEH